MPPARSRSENAMKTARNSACRARRDVLEQSHVAVGGILGKGHGRRLSHDRCTVFSLAGMVGLLFEGQRPVSFQDDVQERQPHGGKRVRAHEEPTSPKYEDGFDWILMYQHP